MPDNCLKEPVQALSALAQLEDPNDMEPYMFSAFHPPRRRCLDQLFIGLSDFSESIKRNHMHANSFPGRHGSMLRLVLRLKMATWMLGMLGMLSAIPEGYRCI